MFPIQTAVPPQLFTSTSSIQSNNTTSTLSGPISNSPFSANVSLPAMPALTGLTQQQPQPSLFMRQGLPVQTPTSSVLQGQAPPFPVIGSVNQSAEEQRTSVLPQLTPNLDTVAASNWFPGGPSNQATTGSQPPAATAPQTVVFNNPVVFPQAPWMTNQSKPLLNETWTLPQVGYAGFPYQQGVLPPLGAINPNPAQVVAQAFTPRGPETTNATPNEFSGTLQQAANFFMAMGAPSIQQLIEGAAIASRVAQEQEVVTMPLTKLDNERQSSSGSSENSYRNDRFDKTKGRSRNSRIKRRRKRSEDEDDDEMSDAASSEEDEVIPNRTTSRRRQSDPADNDVDSTSRPERARRATQLQHYGSEDLAAEDSYADYNGEQRLVIEFENLGEVTDPAERLGKKGVIPDGLAGSFIMYSERWFFRIKFLPREDSDKDDTPRRIEWMIRNDSWTDFHSVQETTDDAVRRNARGVSLCNRTFTDAMEMRAKQFEALLKLERAKEQPDMAHIVYLESRVSVFRPKRFSEGPLLFGLRHRAVQRRSDPAVAPSPPQTTA